MVLRLLPSQLAELDWDSFDSNTSPPIPVPDPSLELDDGGWVSFGDWGKWEKISPIAGHPGSTAVETKSNPHTVRSNPYQPVGDFLSNISNFKLIESTLREGEQLANAFFDTQKKIEIAKALDEFGVDYVELTSPTTSEQSRADCEAICKLGPRARILTCARCYRGDARNRDETGVEGVQFLSQPRQLVDFANCVCDIVIGTSSFVMEHSHGKDMTNIIAKSRDYKLHHLPLARTEEAAADSDNGLGGTTRFNNGRFRRHRRGHHHGRKSVSSSGDWTEDLQEMDPFRREFRFRCRDKSSTMPGVCLLDSQSQIPLAVSKRWVIEAGHEAEISTDFKAPLTQSLSGHPITFNGIIRNMVFSPAGSSITYRRDFLVSDQLDTVADFIIGAKFMLEQCSVLFGKMKKRIAGWFKHKKETPEEKAEAEILKAEQEREAYEAELQRREKKAQIARAREEAQRRKAKQALPDSE